MIDFFPSNCIIVSCLIKSDFCLSAYLFSLWPGAIGEWCRWLLGPKWAVREIILASLELCFQILASSALRSQKNVKEKKKILNLRPTSKIKWFQESCSESNWSILRDSLHWSSINLLHLKVLVQNLQRGLPETANSISFQNVSIVQEWTFMNETNFPVPLNKIIRGTLKN